MPLPLIEHLNFSPYFVDNSKTPGFDWKKYQDKIDALPENLFDVLTHEGTSEFIKSLTRKYAPLGTQGTNLARLVRDAVLADFFLGDMLQETQRRLGLDPVTAKEVVGIIVSQLFRPVLNELKQYHRTRYPGKTSNKQTPSTTPPAADNYPGHDLPETGGNIIDLREQ